MRILVVDDSVVFRSQIKSALEGIEGIVVPHTAANGKIALERLEQSSIDVVILDMEMPEMDGMAVLAEMQKRKLTQKVIVFAAPTGSGIDSVFSALKAGASDFIAKPSSAGSLEQALEGIKKDLIPKILQFKAKIQRKETTPLKPADLSKQTINLQDIVTKQAQPASMLQFKPKAIGIGSSTGGPVALSAVFAQLKGQALQVPIFLAQHMPPNFTRYLAENLSQLSGHPAREAIHGEAVVPGHIYVAPGDFHMTIERSADNSRAIILLDQSPKRNSVRPAVDNLFESLAKVYGENCAVFVLTGMGEDGLVGAKSIKDARGRVMIQDEESSVVWGMPGAIHAAGSFDKMGNLDECANILIQMNK
ncbi:MAG: chemotaxis-specific protein-glutamate methyltransferase CheB [Bdellovibrionota bacterium]